MKHESAKRIEASIVLLVMTLIIVGSIVVTVPKPSSVRKSSSSNGVTAASSTSVQYKDGTYTASGSYNSPGGNESLTLMLTISNDTVTDSTFVPGATDSTAKSYQYIFSTGYKAKVVGKKLSSIKLSNVSGSSLTPIGFNKALETIKSEAKS